MYTKFSTCISTRTVVKLNNNSLHLIKISMNKQTSINKISGRRSRDAIIILKPNVGILLGAPSTKMQISP